MCKVFCSVPLGWLQSTDLGSRTCGSAATACTPPPCPAHCPASSALCDDMLTRLFAVAASSAPLAGVRIL